MYNPLSNLESNSDTALSMNAAVDDSKQQIVLNPDGSLELPDTPPIAPEVCESPIAVFGIQPNSPIAWSNDGAYIAFVAANHGVFLASVGNKISITRRLSGTHSMVFGLTFHPTAPILIAAGAFGLMFWNYLDGKIVQSIGLGPKESHDSPVNCATFCFGGKLLLTGGKDNDMIIWDYTNFQQEGAVYVETIHGHKAAVNYIAFCESTYQVATAGRDAAIKLWDVRPLHQALQTGNIRSRNIQKCLLIKTLDGHRGDVVTVTYNKEGTQLLSGARDNSIKLWNLETLTLLRNIVGNGPQDCHVGDVRRILYLPGEKEILTCGGDGQIKMWHLADAAAAATKGENSGSGDTSVYTGSGLVSDASEITSENFESFLRAEDASDWKLLDKEAAKDRLLFTGRFFRGCHAMELCQQRPIFIVGGAESAVKIYAWQPPKFQPNIYMEYCGYDQAITDLRIYKGTDAADLLFFSSSLDPNFYLFDTKVHRRIKAFAYDMSILCLGLSPDGSLVYAGGTDYDITAYAIDSKSAEMIGGTLTTRPVAKLAGHRGRVEVIAVAPNGKLMVSGGVDFSLCAWDVTKINPESNQLQVLEPESKEEPHSGHIISLAFSYPEKQNDDLLLASGSSDHSFCIWSAKDRSVSKLEQEMDAHGAVITSLQWGKGTSSKILFSGSWDQKVKAWKIEVSGSLFTSVSIKFIASIDLETRIADIGIDESGEHIFVGLASGEIVALHYDVDESKFHPICSYKMKKGTETLTCLDVGSNVILSGFDDGSSVLWPMFNKKSYADFFHKA